MSKNVSRTEAGTPVLETAEEVLHVEKNVQAFLEGPPFNSEGQGDLYVTSRRVIWLHSSSAEKDFSVAFPELSIHAICTDTSTFPSACVYCQVDTSDDSLSELRFVPTSLAAVTSVYTAFSAGAEMNPDPPGSDDEGHGDFFFDEDEVKTNLTMPQVMQSMASIHMPQQSGRFNDAEEDEDEGDEDEEMPQDGA